MASQTIGRAPHTVVIGAGIGGLTAGAILLNAGHRVTILEAQVYPGGCAGTFTYQNYRFDAGATLAGGFAPGGPHHQVAEMLGLEWPITPVDPIAWTVHLPDGRQVHQWTAMDKWREERENAFPGSHKFWATQERLADASWDVSTRPFPWPPAKISDLVTLGLAMRPQTLPAIPHLLSSVADILPKQNLDPMLRLFVDANLLISAQTTADRANALYGSAALELPRRGVNHITGGIGALADTLVTWIRAHGGEVCFRQQVDQIEVKNGRAIALRTNLHKKNKRTQKRLEFDNLLANTTPWGLADLLGEDAPQKLTAETDQREATWGAFMLFLGVHADQLPSHVAGHHQLIDNAEKPLGESNSIFISMSDPHDSGRAPAGMRAINISTHTEVTQWWALRNLADGGAAYRAKRDTYVEQMLTLAERALPGIRGAISLCLPATPVTYEQWTGRPQGMVGGFPQTSIFKARGPQTGLKNCWLVGDSVFPGQSTAGVTLGGLRVARDVLAR